MELRTHIETSLAGRYTIERELGRGGMAVVFLAEDLKHHRRVAIKVLLPELASVLGAERFLREIEIAASLHHPHVLPLYDSGEADGLLYHVMPFAEGESLRDRLEREKQLPLEEALQIAREVADALSYAHDHGVVHRDIKPENILLESGHAVVTDFGIARAISAAGGEKLTATGLAIGTPAYMSPEQAGGEQQLDGRTDVYALGCVLYEMLAGEPPFTGPTPQAIMARALTETPRPLHPIRAAVPASLDGVMAKAMAKTPVDRYATPAELAKALQQVAAAAEGFSPALVAGSRRPPLVLVLGLGFLLGLGVLFAWRSYSGRAAAGGKLVAVLPFENLGAPEDDYFADGMTDAVRGKLADLSGLQVIARSSSALYRKTTKTPQQIADELGVQYLLTGTIRWAKQADGSSRVQVVPELVQVTRVGAPKTKWQQPFDAVLSDVFQVQGDIASQVAGALDVALNPGVQRQLTARPTSNLSAYEAFLRGEQISKGMGVTDPASLRRAISYYEQAVALDSTFVGAWTQLARARAILYFQSTPTPAGAEETRRAAERALALAPNRPEGWHALGAYFASVTLDYPRALEQFAQALRLAPSSADVLTSSAVAERGLGRWQAALEHLREARRLDPRSVATCRHLGFDLLWLRRYREAREALDQCLSLAPSNLSVIRYDAMVSIAQGDLAGARAVLRRAPSEVGRVALVANVALYYDLVWVLDDAQRALLLRLTPAPFDNDRLGWGLALAQAHALRGDWVSARAYGDSARMAADDQLRARPQDVQRRALLGVALAYMGRKLDALREAEHAVALSPIEKDALGGAYYKHLLARVYVLVGEPEKAIDQLEQVLRVPYILSPAWLKIDPNFAPLRSNPRFQRLVVGGS